MVRGNIPVVPRRRPLLFASFLCVASGACSHRTSTLRVIAVPIPAHVAAAPPPARASYVRWIDGDPRDVETHPRGGAALLGGGTDLDDAFRWFLARADGGDVVVLRTTGDDAYDPYLRALGHVDSVATLLVDTRAGAGDARVAGEVRRAEAVFIAGGDQSTYVSTWTDTALSHALQHAVDRGAVIGGTSAGLAVLGQLVYSSMRGSSQSDATLRDPYDADATFARDFVRVAHLGRTITDTHFVARRRLGRLVAFMARLLAERWADEVRGIGVDEGTALLVEPSGQASVAGQGAVYFLRTTQPASACLPHTPLTIAGVSAYRIFAGGSFDLDAWSGRGGAAYTLQVKRGVLAGEPIGPY